MAVLYNKRKGGMFLRRHYPDQVHGCNLSHAKSPLLAFQPTKEAHIAPLSFHFESHCKGNTLI